MIKSKKQMYLVIGAFALVMLLGTVTYAFFNYTRTGTTNTIRTGKIAFTTSQNSTINLPNIFPIEPTVSNLADSTKVGTVSIDISGDTTYGEGIEYLVKAVNVVNTTNQSKTLPISIQVEYAAKESKSIGTPDSTYFTDRGSTTSYYKVLSNSTINNGDRLIVGYIAPGATGIDGTITIKAYLDATKIGISDTYDGTESDNMGTTNEWAQGKTIITTSEWNALQANGVSFQINIEANEGVWVNEQIRFDANGGTISPNYKEIENGATTYGTLGTPTPPSGYTFEGWYTDPVNGTEVTESTSYTSGTSATTLYAHYTSLPTMAEMCPGCQFMYMIDTFHYGGDDNENATIVSEIPAGVVKDDYRDVVSESNTSWFLGFTETQEGKIDRGFACGIKGDAPNQGRAFCIEGSMDGSTYESNKDILFAFYGPYDSETNLGCDDNYSFVTCYGTISAGIDVYTSAYVDSGLSYCDAADNDGLWCSN